MQDSDKFKHRDTESNGNVQGLFGAEHRNLDSGVGSLDNLLRYPDKFVAHYEAEGELLW